METIIQLIEDGIVKNEVSIPRTTWAEIKYLDYLDMNELPLFIKLHGQDVITKMINLLTNKD